MPPTTQKKPQKDTPLKDLMDALFRIPPVKVPLRDGSGEKVTIEHRIGKDAGFITRPQLMDKLGLEEVFAECTRELQKRIRDEERLKELLDEKYQILKNRANRAVQDYRKILESFYGSYPLPMLPMFAWVPISENLEGLFIQGLCRQNDLFHLIGDPADNLLWSEVTFAATKSFADLNKRAENTARALMALPGLNKDLKHRAHALSQGKLPEKLGYSPDEKKAKV